MKPKLNPPLRLAIACEYAIGLPLKQIAHDYQISATQVSRTARDYGVPGRYGSTPRRHSPTPRKTYVLNLYQSHIPVREIARLAGMSYQGVSNIATRAGLRRLPYLPRSS